MDFANVEERAIACAKRSKAVSAKKLKCQNLMPAMRRSRWYISRVVVVRSAGGGPRVSATRNIIEIRLMFKEGTTGQH